MNDDEMIAKHNSKARVKANPEKTKAYAQELRSRKHSAAHPGFKGAQHQIAEKQGISEERAGAILAAGARNASAAAHKANPRLNRVKG